MFIFGFYLVGISCLPCTDGGMNALPTPMAISINHSDDHKDHQHDHETETCSPLCQCGCCSISVNQPQPINNYFAPPKHSSELVLSSYESLHPKGYWSSIWQPPKCTVWY